MLIGFPMSGSEAYNCISKPSGRLNPNRSSSGVRASVVRMLAVKFDPLYFERSSVLLLQLAIRKNAAKTGKIKILFIIIIKFKNQADRLELYKKRGTCLLMYLFIFWISS